MEMAASARLKEGQKEKSMKSTTPPSKTAPPLTRNTRSERLPNPPPARIPRRTE